MKHLIFLIPDFKETCDIAKELEQVGVKNHDLHVYSDSPETIRGSHIHPLNVFHMVHINVIIGRAFVFGVIFSLIIYLLFKIELPPTMPISTLGYIGIISFSLGFGFWVSGMIGLQSLKEFQTKYQDYVREGHYLMMVDAMDKREKELVDLIMSHHVDVQYSDESDINETKH